MSTNGNTMSTTPVKRGSSLCQTCGSSNGNRANACKGCGQPFAKKAKVIVPSSVSVTHSIFSNNVTSLVQKSTNVLPPGSEIYSVRIRDQGPDYRCFVTHTNGKWKCHYTDCMLVQDCSKRSGEHCEPMTCQHIRDAYQSQCRKAKSVAQQPVCVDRSLLNDIPFPPAVQAEFEAYLIHGQSALVQRVSSTSFVLVTSVSSESPFGLLHARIGTNKMFQCTCHKFKRAARLASVTTAPKLSKRCTHFYMFLWAVLSNESLKKEFMSSISVPGKESLAERCQAQVTSGNVRDTTKSDVTNEKQEPPAESTTSGNTTDTHNSDVSNEKRGVARRATIQVTEQIEKIPESTSHPIVQQVLENIRIKNANTTLHQLDTQLPNTRQMIWQSEYTPQDVECCDCKHQLPERTKLPGTRGKTWLVNRNGLQEVSVYVKTCKNQDCQARHSFRDWKSGVFNISNKMLVSLDTLFEMREHVRRGEPPGNTSHAVIQTHLGMPYAPKLSPGEIRYLTEKLYDGYFAFEVLTQRDWDSAICGICGVCPIFESGDGNAKNCTQLHREMIQWPTNDDETHSATGKVDVDQWWNYLDQKILEGIAFKDINLEQVNIVDIAPWIPPA